MMGHELGERIDHLCLNKAGWGEDQTKQESKYERKVFVIFSLYLQGDQTAFIASEIGAYAPSKISSS